jgi:hypothetical protein
VGRFSKGVFQGDGQLSKGLDWKFV